jgi:multimeric flavodoxin WrbA
MKICIINGSPKGEYGTTLSIAKYLINQYPQYQYEIIHPAAQIAKYEHDPERWESAIKAIKDADLVLWFYPLYYFYVHAGLKRFIELLFERNPGILEGKYCAGYSTSIHMADNIAASYISAISEDLGARFCGVYTAAMGDFSQAKVRKHLKLFFEQAITCVGKKLVFSRKSAVLPVSQQQYKSGLPINHFDIKGKKILIVTDRLEGKDNLRNMVNRVSAAFAGQVETQDIESLDAKYCIGCCCCGFENICTLEKADKYCDFIRQKFVKADAIIIAAQISDRYFSAKWKNFMDRFFFYSTHHPALRGKQLALLVSGPFSQMAELQQAFKIISQVHGANLSGWVSDEDGDIDKQLDSLCQNLAIQLANGYIAPADFTAVGFNKILRDDLYEHRKFPFIADHKYFVRNDLYDFPYKAWKHRLGSSIMMTLSYIPAVRKIIKKEMIARMKMFVEKYEKAE